MLTSEQATHFPESQTYPFKQAHLSRP